MATRAAGAAKAAGAAGAAGDTVALGAAPCRPLPPFPPLPPLPPPTAQTASTKTATPGTKLHPITARTFALPDASRYHAASGPSTAPAWSIPRSEEHTSELQSLAYLVCRLLLEKKNTNETQATSDPSSLSR